MIMFEQVREMLSKQLRISADKITPDSLIKDDLGADSLDVMEMLMTIEEDYGIVIPDDDIVNFKTVGDIVDYLDSHKISTTQTK